MTRTAEPAAKLLRSPQCIFKLRVAAGPPYGSYGRPVEVGLGPKCRPKTGNVREGREIYPMNSNEEVSAN